MEGTPGRVFFSLPAAITLDVRDAQDVRKVG